MIKLTMGMQNINKNAQWKGSPPPHTEDNPKHCKSGHYHDHLNRPVKIQDNKIFRCWLGVPEP